MSGTFSRSGFRHYCQTAIGIQHTVVSPPEGLVGQKKQLFSERRDEFKQIPKQSPALLLSQRNKRLVKKSTPLFHDGCTVLRRCGHSLGDLKRHDPRIGYDETAVKIVANAFAFIALADKIKATRLQLEGSQKCSQFKCCASIPKKSLNLQRPLSIRPRTRSYTINASNTSHRSDFTLKNTQNPSSLKSATNQQYTPPVESISTSIKSTGNRLYTVGCGFSKDDNPNKAVEGPEYCINFQSEARNFGEDAAFILSNVNNADIIGVSDGVGGWRNQGVDPSIFSRTLMHKCKKFVEGGNFKVDKPVQLLSRAYNDMYSIPDLIGSATACLATFDRDTSMLYTANLGDSGFVVVRDNEVVHKSRSQVHAFNAPFQLSIVPKYLNRGSYGDAPHKADFASFQCEEGDIIIMASDGMFDNIYDNQLIDILTKLGVVPEILDKYSVDEFSETSSETSEDEGITIEANRPPQPTSTIDQENLEQNLTNAASAIVEIAREFAHRKDYKSPFAMEARQYGYQNTLGGKVDDITVLVSIVGAR